jgi:predicted DNA-binding transcriptional regulator AlpA
MTDTTDETSQGVRGMLTAEQVLKRIPFSRTTLFRLERDGLFPKGKPVTPHRKLWFEDQVIGWQRQLDDPDSALSQAMAKRASRRAQSV